MPQNLPVIILKEITEQDGHRVYHFVHLRSDGIELDSLNITTAPTGIIRTIEVLRNSEGDAAFSATGALLHCEAWESEDAAQAVSYLSKHYTARLAIEKGKKKDGLRIFENLRQSIYDTYLKHLLGVFPGKKTKILFDADLYSLPIPVTEPSITPEKIPDEVVTSPPEPPGSFNRFIPRSRIARFVVVGFVPSLFCGTFLLVRKKLQYQELSADLKQLITADLLPVLPVLEKGFETTLREFRLSAAAQPTQYIRKEKSLSHKNLGAFLDQIFPADRKEQVIILHNSAILRNKASDFQKADALRRLYSENLMRVVTASKPERIYIAHDYLLNQANKESLIQYLFFLITQYPNSALEREALLILANIIEIQQRLIDLLFGVPDISAFCNSTAPEDIDDIKQRFVCLNYSKYRGWTTIQKTDLQGKFNDLTFQVLSYPKSGSANRYRINDFKFEKASFLMAIAKNTDQWLRGKRILDSISPSDNHFGFFHREVYLKLITLILKNHHKLVDATTQAKQARLLERKTHELDQLREKISDSQDSLASLKRLQGQAAMEYNQKSIQGKIARAEKFSKKAAR
jgi:hypothetical protein